MTTYADPDDFRALALPPGLLEGVSDGVLTRFLYAASLEADSLGLRARYTLPLATWTDDIRQKVAQLAIFPVMVFEGFNPDAPQNVVFSQLTKDARDWFRGVGKRTVHPALPDAAKRSPVPIVSSPNKLRGW